MEGCALQVFGLWLILLSFTAHADVYVNVSMKSFETGVGSALLLVKTATCRHEAIHSTLSQTFRLVRKPSLPFAPNPCAPSSGFLASTCFLAEL